MTPAGIEEKARHHSRYGVGAWQHPLESKWLMCNGAEPLRQNNNKTEKLPKGKLKRKEL
ncbi:hypothetical protein JCM9157_2489 [Halalkalibacter akibai JCM 9157]|uniref:Uncharacterized protein n=1 Tax=Halalkalibacter akibai (strain ATCC 43226 / DSM 21942 / CIP 109018 / JCM 9157 / 1139) TaxID=1236973 RepID=W4QU01_HALA3|nr:hypothetical protein JCM9157_2489 [Halalkalibacter akibai JCM 9157]